LKAILASASRTWWLLSGKKPRPSGFFYGFEAVTWYPIDLELVDGALLSPEEKTWLNSYHQAIYKQLVPFLSQDEIEL